MANSVSGSKVGPARRPLHTRFKKAQSDAGAVREAAKAATQRPEKSPPDQISTKLTLSCVDGPIHT